MQCIACSSPCACKHCARELTEISTFSELSGYFRQVLVNFPGKLLNFSLQPLNSGLCNKYPVLAHVDWIFESLKQRLRVYMA